MLHIAAGLADAEVYASQLITFLLHEDASRGQIFVRLNALNTGARVTYNEINVGS